MILATSIGISILDFWEITPYELDLAVRGYCKRKESEAEEYQIKLKNEQRLLTIQAYEISRWVWVKRLDIKKILEENEPKKKEMSDDEMLAQVQLLNNLFGGIVEEGRE